MSELQSTDNIITDEALQAMYNFLLPYLNQSSSGGVSSFDELSNLPEEASDIDDVITPLPGTPTRYPVLFDESGTEYIVGYYVNSQGLKKPVYEKVFSDTVLLKGQDWTTTNITLSNIDSLINIIASITNSQVNSGVGAYIDANSKLNVYSHRNGDFGTETWNFKLQYTKTTDNFE